MRHRETFFVFRFPEALLLQYRLYRQIHIYTKAEKMQLFRQEG